jgi:hypothetical protein
MAGSYDLAIGENNTVGGNYSLCVGDNACPGKGVSGECLAIYDGRPGPDTMRLITPEVAYNALAVMGEIIAHCGNSYQRAQVIGLLAPIAWGWKTL